MILLKNQSLLGIHFLGKPKILKSFRKQHSNSSPKSVFSLKSFQKGKDQTKELAEIGVVSPAFLLALSGI